MSTATDDRSSFQHQPSTSSGPLLPDDVSQPPSTDDFHTIFTDGRTPVNISARHLKNHPLHEPTGTSAVLTFYPTMEEFRDFKKYIEKVERHGAHLTAGIAKIVAPEGWTPRPSKKNFSDVDDYEITSPAQETITAVENKPGAYFKKNEVHHKKMSAKEFRQKANSPKFSNPKPNLKGSAIEKHYFDNILRGEPIYGADTEGSFYDENVDEFNMSRLGTVLDRTAGVIKGVNTVYLYFGMYKTTFPWHAEDMDLYSINFLHFGEPKYWFAISSEHADRFERFMNQQFATHSEGNGKRTCRAFLRHKSYIVTPELLRAAKIPFATMMQRPNEFIITFPRGYHMGFNLGYNLAESTNFATERWIDYGKDATLCYCSKDSVKIDMKPFMQEHRRDEFVHWDTYWYGARSQEELKDLVKCKRKAIQGSQSSKKRRLESSNGSCSESCSSGSEEELSSFMSTLPGYTFSSSQFKPDHEALLTKFKKDMKILRSDAVDFYQERMYNQARGAEWPHCAVCQYFQPVHMTTTNSIIPDSSRRLLPSSCFSKSPSQVNEKEDDMSDNLLTCSNCNVTVHSTCCSGDQPEAGVGWKCPRCRNHTENEIRTASCQFCQLRGGPLIPCQIGRDSTWVHVICALFNRRAAFNRPSGPTSCFVEPYKRQHSETPSMPRISNDYRTELGDLYQNLRWQCLVCKKVEAGLIPCAHCIEESSTLMPSLAHITCARRIGFVCEVRDHPRGTTMICPKHGNSYLSSKSSETWKYKTDTNYHVEDDQSPSGFSSGIITTVEMKPTIVADFLDNSCSRDILPEEVQSCECLQCENNDHQYGSRIKVVWDDDKIYDAYYRGKGFTREYTVELTDGRILKCGRSKIKTKREYTALSKNTL